MRSFHHRKLPDFSTVESFVLKAPVIDDKIYR